MKSDSLIKVTACVLTFTLIITSCNISFGSKKDDEIVSSEIIAGDLLMSSEEKSILYSNKQFLSHITFSEDVNTVEIAEVTQTPETTAAPSEATQATVAPTEVPVTTAPATKEPKESSKYENVGVSVADPYVYIRKDDTTDSEALGKLYKGCAATITKDLGEWVQIKSGSVKGYIKSSYLARGLKVEELIDKYATKYATVNTTTLNVREKKDENSTILTQVPEGETYEVESEDDKWVKVSIDDGDIKGYLSKEFVKMNVEFQKAVSVEEEKAEESAAEERKQAEKEQLKKLQSTSSSDDNQTKSSSSKSSSQSTHESSNDEDDNDQNASGGQSVAQYALKFVGNPYVYGGTSLTSGTDCSGFVLSVYRSFGYSLGRSSRDQAASAGKQVSMSSIRPGDLLFYTSSSGTINHVAIYIGNGQVVHASNPRDGIKVSNYKYRTPCMARRVIY